MAGAPIGNNNNKKNKIWSEALYKYITQNPKALLKAAEALVTKAQDGDVTAIKELGDRLEGKSIQGIEMSGELKSVIVQASLLDEQL